LGGAGEKNKQFLKVKSPALGNHKISEGGNTGGEEKRKEGPAEKD